jgi:response regulator RpfG family c-di-GMP phosphodiesterase
MAELLGVNPHDVETIRLGAILHDVGKIGIPDRVLLKPGPLDEEERRIIETHPEIGDKLLEPLDLLAAARPIVRHHHERWDGAGYPDGLAGTDIPFGARIVSVVDSIEVMTSRQLYREPRAPDEVVAELIACRAKQWDPQIVDLALRMIESGELELAKDGLRLLEPPAAVPAGPALAVLLVEDDDKYALLVTSALERALDGAVIARAHSVASAAELVSGSEWSLAIVDDGLENGHGMQVLDALRLSNPRLPVVMVTALTSDVTAVEAFRHGASDYVVKGDAYVEALAARVRTLVTV